MVAPKLYAQMEMENNLFSETTTCSVSSVGVRKLMIKKKLTPRKVLRSRMKETEQRNCELEHLLITKDSEINDLKKNIDSLNEIISSAHAEDFGRGSTIATSKITGLSRKIRRLTADLEFYKSKYEKDHAKLIQLETEPERLKKEITKKESKESTKKVPNNAEILQEQLQSSKQKIFELLNQNTELKNNLKLAQKCIQQEIGENINLNILAQSNSTWRGRAQQIIALQTKISELKYKLESKGPEDTYKMQMRQMEAKKKTDFDLLSKKLSDLEGIVEEQKMKIAALKIRNKNLTDDAMNYKLKTLNLLELSGENDCSLAVINENMNIMKYQHEHQCKEFNEKIAGLSKELSEEKVEHGRTRAEFDNIKQLLEGKENEIKNLLETIKRLEDEMRTECGDFLFACRDFKKEEFVGLLNALEAEKQDLMQHNKTLKDRIDLEQEKSFALYEKSSKQKLKIARLDAKIKELQKEQDIQQDKRKRTQRIADYANNISSRLSTMYIENSSSYIEIPQKYEKEAASEKLQLEEFKNNLELANEKIGFLEEKCVRLKAEKEQDANMFTSMMNNSKQVLLNIIQKNKNLVNCPTEGSVEKLDMETKFSSQGPCNSLMFSELTLH